MSFFQIISAEYYPLVIFVAGFHQRHGLDDIDHAANVIVGQPRVGIYFGPLCHKIDVVFCIVPILWRRPSRYYFAYGVTSWRGLESVVDDAEGCTKTIRIIDERFKFGVVAVDILALPWLAFPDVQRVVVSNSSRCHLK